MGIAAWLHGLGLQQYEQAFSDRDDVTVALDPRTADGDGSMVSARLADGRAELGRQPLAQRPAPPVDASLRREAASDHEDNAEREAVADPLRDPSLSAEYTGQRDRNMPRSNRNVRVGSAVLPSILCGLRMGYHVADARGPRHR